MLLTPPRTLHLEHDQHMMKGIGRSQPVASTSAASLPPTGSSGSADSLGSTDASLKRLLDTDGADSGAGEDDADGRAAKVIKRGVKACTAVSDRRVLKLLMWGCAEELTTSWVTCSVGRLV